jgi:hypothetical protein
MPTRPTLLHALIAACAFLSACATDPAVYDRAVARDTPPRDFTLSVTVQAPTRTAPPAPTTASTGADSSATTSTPTRAPHSIITPGRAGFPGRLTFVPAASSQAVASMPLALRPARYVLETDWILRSGVGAGATESFYPYQTRQLDAPQATRVWQALKAGGVLAPNHPGIVSRAPDAEAPSTATLYVISYSIAQVRRTVVVEAPPIPPSPPAATDASATASSPSALITLLAELSWMHEPPVADATPTAAPSETK